MLVVDFDPNRPHDEGQFHVRLIDSRSGDYGNDAKRQSQLGYWCDLGHLESGVLRPVLAAVQDARQKDTYDEGAMRCIRRLRDGWRTRRDGLGFLCWVKGDKWQQVTDAEGRALHEADW